MPDYYHVRDTAPVEIRVGAVAVSGVATEFRCEMPSRAMTSTRLDGMRQGAGVMLRADGRTKIEVTVTLLGEDAEKFVMGVVEQAGTPEARADLARKFDLSI